MRQVRRSDEGGGGDHGDGGLDLILGHMGLEVEFPKVKPARSLPRWGGEDTQGDPSVEVWEGISEAVGE